MRVALRGVLVVGARAAQNGASTEASARVVRPRRDAGHVNETTWIHLGHNMSNVVRDHLPVSSLVSRVLVSGPLEISRDGPTVIAGRELMLPGREWALLISLAQNAGRVVLRDQLHRDVWGYVGHRGKVLGSCVWRLRSMLERASPDWEFIHTHFGWGYRLAPQLKAPLMSTLAHPLGRDRPRPVLELGEYRGASRVDSVPGWSVSGFLSQDATNS